MKNEYKNQTIRRNFSTSFLIPNKKLDKYNQEIILSVIQDFENQKAVYSNMLDFISQFTVVFLYNKLRHLLNFF